MKDLTNFEQAVLDKLLFGDHPILTTLRTQAKVARLVKREHTGVGFFCSFEVPSGMPVVTTGQGDFQIDDVNGELEGLAHGAGFVLFIREGRLDTLEGFSYDEPWPSEMHRFTLTYQSEPRNLQLPI